METVGSKKDLYEMLPIQDIRDGVIISKRGEVTIGWEMTMPVVYAAMEDGYDEIVNTFAAAAKLLPAWTMIHRQDVFTYDEYHGDYDGRYLSDCFSEHFEGRRLLRHRQYLFLTMTSKASALKSNGQTAAFGIRFSAPLPSEQDLWMFNNKADEFISVLTSCEFIDARKLTSEELEGVGMKTGIIDSYLTFCQDSPMRSDYVIQPDKVRIFDKEMLGFKISESEELPGEVSNISRVGEAGGPYELFLSYGSALGVRLDCEHVVNQYILMPSQASVLQELDRKKKKMTSMLNSPENRVNAEQIQLFIDDVHREGKTCCYYHLNVLAWGSEEDELDLKGKVSAAISTMGVTATQALCDLPSLFFAGVPGGACEIGKDNLMTSELGPSGSGKSFFTNYFLQQCYDAGEHIFVIDVGDSYEGLCQIINETSGGKEYNRWKR